MFKICELETFPQRPNLIITTMIYKYYINKRREDETTG